jgi:hypothetical protein
VFSSAERISVDPSQGVASDTCCTEHVEEQVAPDTLLGTQFVVPHSPYRSQAAPYEADLIRVMAASGAATITTNLSSPYDSMTLQPGLWVDVWVTGDTIISSSAPIVVAQFLAGKAFTNPTSGDPSFVLIPPLSQHHSDYRIVVPAGWNSNAVTFAAPSGALLMLDGAPLSGNCVLTSVGKLGTNDYSAGRCAVSVGYHTVTSSSPLSLQVYGYSQAGAYAFAAAGR